MGLAEDANKVQRITAGSGAALRQMYTPALLQQALPGLRTEAGSLLHRPDSPAAVAAVAARLPPVRPSTFLSSIPPSRQPTTSPASVRCDLPEHCLQPPHAMRGPPLPLT